MRDGIRRYLDEAAPSSGLPPEEEAEAQAWDRMLEAFRVVEPTGSAPSWLEDRVMAEIETLPEPGVLSRAGAWILRPMPLRVSPAMLGLAAAAMAGLLLIPGGDVPPGDRQAGTGATAVVYVQFMLDAPGARSVAVGGDFDAWSGSHELADPDGDGVWTGRVPVEPGVHTYMFLLNGSDWVTDPGATRYNDDGFGNRNAVLAVSAPAT